VLGALALTGVIGWTLLAEIPLLKVSQRGRIEPHNAVHRIEPSAGGRVLRSLLELDKVVDEGDLLIEFDATEQRLDLARSNATVAALTRQLSMLEGQISSKQDELAASRRVDEASLEEAAARERELAPRRRLAEQREHLAANSLPGSTSELEKLERQTEVEALEQSSRTQTLSRTRLLHERAAQREALTTQLLGFERERLAIQGQLAELVIAIDRLEYEIEKRLVRAPAAGRLVDVVELAADDYIPQGQRLGTVLATGDAPIRVRARFAKDSVGIVRRGQRAQLKLDSYPWTIYGTVPALVSSVGTEPGLVATPEAIPGSVRVELDLQGSTDSRISLQHGLTATVEIEVARVSPLALLLRAIGDWSQAPSPPPETPVPGPAVAEAEAH
jgi:membrane fusion protein (multidrug efflux system)